MNKYEDLTKQIADDLGFADGSLAVAGISLTLEWLDEHPEQVPGRTITQSEWAEVMGRNDGKHWACVALLEKLGAEVVPDPKPTNAEMLEAFLREAEAAPMSVTNRARWMDAQGVKAPEADDE